MNELRSITELKGELIKPRTRAAMRAVCEDEGKVRSLITMACKAVSENAFLSQVARQNPVSVQTALVEALQLDLVIDGTLGEAYLVPYGGASPCVQLQPGYLGLKRLAFQSGSVVDFDMGTISEGEERGTDWDFQQGRDVDFWRRPKLEQHEAGWTHAFAYAHLVNGGFRAVVWSFEQVQAHVNKYVHPNARGRADHLWKTNPRRYGEKTAIRDLCKLLPLARSAMMLVQRDEYRETMPSNRISDGDTIKADNAADEILGISTELTNNEKREIEASERL